MNLDFIAIYKLQLFLLIYRTTIFPVGNLLKEKYHKSINQKRNCVVFFQEVFVKKHN